MSNPLSREINPMTFSTALGGAVTTAQVADVIIQAVLTDFQARVGLIALLSEDESGLDCERIVGIAPSEADAWRSIPMDTRAPLADAVRERRMVVMLSAEVHDAIYPELAGRRSRAAEGAVVAVPLLVGDRCVGGIELICPPECCESNAQQTALWALASQCALALDRSRFYDKEKRVREEAQAEIEERKGIEEALIRSEERLRLALDAGGLGTWHWDLTTDIMDWPPTTKALFGLPPDASTERERLLGLLHPDDREMAVAAMHAAVDGGPDYDVEYRVLRPDGSVHWIASRGRVKRDERGTALSMEGIVTDITERAERERRERLLADLAERARSLTDPDDVIADALRSVGQFLGVARCVFVDIDIPSDTCTGHADYCADDAVVSMMGTFPISAFGEYVTSAYAAGRAVVVDDVREDSTQVPPENVATYDAVGIRAHASVPVVHSSRLVSCIGAHSATPRHWTAEEVELLRVVVERTWLTVEVARQQRALVREVEERRAAHERTSVILESITDAFYALDSQFRFTHVNKQAEILWGRSREDLLGRPFLEVFPQVAGSVPFSQHLRVMAEREPTRYDTISPIIGKWVDVSLYPTADGGLSVFFRDISERKALELERSALAERERNIANQLQEALQPAPPEHVPGLSVGKFTRPALAEAQIGGDFYDIFPLDKELYALVIGDVSGKGLAAAQQLALIRNSLRTTLYLFRRPALAAAALSRIVTSHDLLAGFVTAWVGVYDAASGCIGYCSCGHEPALVRRAATGLVEQLATTGPPLGVSEEAEYSECVITLGSGDTFLLYTDGISESGPSRQELLGTEGLIRMLAALAAGLDAQAEAEALVGQVSANAGGVFRDDVAMLLARRE